MTAIGTITPSSNIVVERVTAAVLADIPGASGHFTRIPVAGDKVHLSERHDMPTMVAAAKLLADARLDVICWNGSKAGGIGFDADRDLCAHIAAATGTKATTSILGIEAAFQRLKVKRFALVTPFPEEYQRKVVGVFAREGYAVPREAHLDIYDNYEISQVPERRIAEMVRQVAADKPDAVLILCTNFFGAPVAGPLEAELSLPVLDSVSIGVWQSLREAGVDTRPAARWGCIFGAGD